MKKQKSPSPQRLEILRRIQELERQRRFDQDVEPDPPAPPLLPEQIDYLHKGFLGNCRRLAAFAGAYLYFWSLEWRKLIKVNRAEGLQYLANVQGAVITCNHFHPMDSFIMQRIFDDSGHKKRLYRVIREGNYTGFPGFFGFMMRNCNTLPLSANLQTMKKFLQAVRTVLQNGNCILIYPEQSMWWNYRKPKPMKSGAFDMAVKNNVPVIPCFITMKDLDKPDRDGLPVKEYTPHLGEPLYPDTTLSKPEAKEKLRQQNEAFCRQIYEQVYGTALVYD
jgi:1-acyl-sn-glycerol-3-phosphate acyltransferase